MSREDLEDKLREIDEARHTVRDSLLRRNLDGIEGKKLLDALDDMERRTVVKYRMMVKNLSDKDKRRQKEVRDKRPLALQEYVKDKVHPHIEKKGGLRTD